eukprot:TRINITY_DN14557_c0_g1_i1.p1 TRINITY_DN14557_c0_g1~~TRINITY_DN14557_c0_g1_i1.p1  ORF type:complete len:322 (+),score=81.11 TRINITY_DN14557_c0_g1_i1:101-1066(+)
MVREFCFLLALPLIASQSCTWQDFAIQYDGATYFTVSSANDTCTCRGAVVAGPGRSSFAGNISVQGRADLLGALAVTGTATFSAATSFIGPSSTFSGPATFSGGTSFTGGSNVFSGAASFTGATAFSGASNTFSGPAAFTNSMSVSGAASFSSASTFSGTATFQNTPPMIVNPLFFTGVSDGTTQRNDRGYIQRDFYVWNSYQSVASSCVHLKTNILTNSGGMYRFTLEGYGFAASANIDSVAVGYAYASTNNIAYNSVTNNGWGVLSQYKSADAYVTLKFTMTDSYYVGFTVSAYQTHTSHTIGAPIQILDQRFPSCTNF